MHRRRHLVDTASNWIPAILASCHGELAAAGADQTRWLPADLQTRLVEQLHALGDDLRVVLPVRVPGIGVERGETHHARLVGAEQDGRAAFAPTWAAREVDRLARLVILAL